MFGDIQDRGAIDKVVDVGFSVQVFHDTESGNTETITAKLLDGARATHLATRRFEK